MTVSDLREELRQLTKLHFTGAEVIFTKHSFIAKPASPLISLTMGPISRPVNPPIITIDGRPAAVYPPPPAFQKRFLTGPAPCLPAGGISPFFGGTDIGGPEWLSRFKAFL